MRVTETLSNLADEAGLDFSQQDIGKLGAADIVYRGWWRSPNLKSLGHVVPLGLSLPEFLGRCTEIFKLFENLQPAALRQIVLRLGLKKESIGAFGGVKLLATICQLASIATDGGFDLVSDSSQVSATWDTTRIIADLQPLFALNAIRTADAHTVASSLPANTAKALEAFGIDEAQCRSGWGKALDLVYDQIIYSLGSIDALIAGSWKPT